MPLIDDIKSRLTALTPLLLEIEDDSAQHTGHKGNNGGGHFSLTIVSSQFCGKSQIIRHRAIYQLLNDLIPNQIHALSIQAIASDESFSQP